LPIGSALIFLNVSAYWLRAVLGLLILATVLATWPAAKSRRADNDCFQSLLRHETILAVLTVIALAVLSAQSDKFFTVDNLLNQGRLMTEVGLVALAMTFVIVTGGIDLSVGSILGLTAILLGVFWKNLGLPLPLAIAGALPRNLRGLRQRLHHHPLQVCRRSSPRWRRLRSIAALPRASARHARCAAIPSGSMSSARETFWASPSQLWMLGIATASLPSSSGSHPGAVPLMPLVPMRRRRAFPASASMPQSCGSIQRRDLSAALAAVIFVSRVTTTRSDMGTGLELDVITGVVLGGTSIFGGRGTIIGTVLGLILIQALKNGLSLSGVKGDGTIVVIGWY
jgi:rhamnose transport system permease protein